MAATIRSAVPDDVPDLLRIEQEAASAAHWTSEQYHRRVSEGVVMVAVEGGSVGGFAVACVVAGEWEIENIVVAVPLRRRGIADRFLEELLRRARDQGAVAVRLEVRESNHPARRLYEKHGFRESGRRSEYYKNPTEAAVLYHLAAVTIQPVISP